MSKVTLGIEKITEKAKEPKRATQHSACWDLEACLHTPTIVAYDTRNVAYMLSTNQGSVVVLDPHHRALIPTGLIFHIPEGWSVRINPRSGKAIKSGLRLCNNTGIVDCDYKLETFIALINDSDVPVEIRHGDCVAQMESMPVVELAFDNSRTEVVSDRNGGFGSTGN